MTNRQKNKTGFPMQQPIAVTRDNSAGRNLRLAGTLVLIFASLCWVNQADARWYKWVDEDGNISYQDRPPPTSYDQSTQVLNNRGVTVKRIPGSEEQKQLLAKQAVEDARRLRDVRLIKTFPNEFDLISTRDKRLAHIDGNVGRMHDQLVILHSRLSSIEGKIRALADRGQAVNRALDSDRIAVMRSIDSTNALIKSKIKERRQVAARFANDLTRYRELASRASTAALDQ